MAVKRIGRFELTAVVQEGGSNTGYLALDPTLKRTVKVNVLETDLAEDLVSEFMRQVNSVAKLSHPSLTEIYETGIVDDKFYYVEAYEVEKTLEDVLMERKKLSLSETVHFLSQIAHVADYVQARGIHFIDLKPSNILVLGDATIKVVEPGREFSPMEPFVDPQALHTDYGTLIGTPAYLAPERILGKKATVATDVYALGILAYQMLTGQLPFEGPIAAILYNHVHTDPPNPLKISPHLDKKVAKALLKALAKDPSKRFSSAGDFVKALQEATKQNSTTTGQYKPPTVAALVTMTLASASIILFNLVAPILSEMANTDLVTIAKPSSFALGLIVMISLSRLFIKRRENEQRALIEQIRNQSKASITSQAVPAKGRQL